MTDGELEEEEDIHVCKKCNLVSITVFNVSEQDLTDGELEEEEDIHRRFSAIVFYLPLHKF